MRQYYNIVLAAAVTAVLALLFFNIFSDRYKEREYNSSFEWPEGKKMGLSLTFDDGRNSQIDKGIPLFDKYGVKGTFYVSTQNIVGRTEKWRRAAANGHEIGNHTLSHPCTGNFTWTMGYELEYFTLDRMRDELEAASEIIRDSLGVVPVSFAYPCGQTFVGSGIETKSYVPLVATMFQTGRGWLDEGPNDPMICDMAHLLGMNMDGMSFREVKRMIEFAKRTGKWLILVGHEMDVKGDQTTYLSTLDAICKYATDPANEIWIDNVQNIASYISEKRNDIIVAKALHEEFITE
jgi:peptidoglycan/xylan/chitin deacetylase (PgdA/CDA1 family)